MNTFLDHVVWHLIATKGVGELAKTTFVVPTRRAILSVKESIRKYMRQYGLQCPVQLPALTTLSELFDTLSPKYKMDELQLVCTLYRVYNEVTGSSIPLDVFYGWGKQLVQDFSNIDKTYPLVTSEDFLRNTASARLLENLKIDEEVRERLLGLVSLRQENAALIESKRREFELIWQHLPLIYQRFNEELGIYAYEGARMLALLVNWEEESVQNRLKGRQFVFAGFNYLVPAEKQLMHMLQKSNQATFYWDYPDHFQANAKAFRWIQRNKEEFGNALPVKDWQTKQVEVICAASSAAQTQYIYDWLQQTHQQGDRTAVVICDESVLEQVIYALPNCTEKDERFKHINITKGFPLRHTAIYAECMKILQTARPDFDCNAVLQQLEKLLQSKFNEWEKSFFENSEETEGTVDELVELSWHELLARESVFQLTCYLNRFRQMLKVGNIPPIPNLRTLRLMLRRYLENISFPFHGEPLANVQITGVLETRALDFDNVLLLNVEEGVVPHVSADLSYLPYYLRKTYGLQTHEESTDVYAYNFFRLMYRAKNVTLMFTGNESANNKKSMSRFLRQMMASSDFKVTKKLLVEPNILANPILPIDHLNTLNVLPVEAFTRFSPSALNTFKECPMKFYLKYVATIKEPQTTQLTLGYNELGTLVHNAVQELYTIYSSPLDIPEPIPFDTLNSLKMEGNHPMELAAIRTFITRIIQLDRQLASQQPLEIFLTEKPVFLKIQVPGFGGIEVGGRLDRVDKLGVDYRIIDYKTGKDKKDYDFQISIYREAWMAENRARLEEENHPTVRAGLYLCKTGTSREVTSPTNFTDQLQKLLLEIMTFIEKSSVTLPPLAAKATTCYNCAYKILCGKSTDK